MILDRTFREFAADLRSDVEAEFIRAVSEIHDFIVIQRLRQAIDAGDIDLALKIAGVGEGNIFPTVFAMVSGGFLTAGMRMARGLNRSKKSPVGIFQFDRTTPDAEAWARQNAAKFVVNVSDGTRTAVRDFIVSGMDRGRGALDIARDIAGRTVNGKRTGGIIGLSHEQVTAVDNARRDLESGSRSYFSRELRDRRYDSKIRKYMLNGKRIPKGLIDQVITRYSSRLLYNRAERIARTEVMGALHAGRFNAMVQMIQGGHLTYEQVKKRWKSSLLKRTRDTHRDLHNKTVGILEPFVTLKGASLMWPHDSSMDAPPGEIINCRCYMEFEVKF